jgi:hypothetical protein
MQEIRALAESLPAALPCERCGGAGRCTCPFCKGGGCQFCEGGSDPCSACDARGVFFRPDPARILSVIFGPRGGLRKPPFSDREAYAVWRWARFHGGKDVSLPVTAGVATWGYPKEYQELLDRIAEQAAERAFGSHWRGAARWAKALGYYSRSF